jgi:hypothetical protein
MNRLSTLALCVVATTAAGAGTAGAATLTTDTRCYQETQDVVVSGAGFTPLSAVTITRDDAVLGTAQADANGAFRNKFATPELPGAVRERAYRLSATDMLSTATTGYRATRIFANFRPSSGNPSTLRVRFTVNGFGLTRRRAPVYLHYVSPKGSARRTIRLGTAGGVCGTIRATRPRRLFPFNAQQGTWILQFDTRRTYQRATSKRRTPWVRKPVQIFSSRR